MEIREIYTIQELEKVQKLEVAVWETHPVPIHQTLTAIKNGGIMVGAFIGEKLIGFSYGFAGFKNGKAHLTSHMMAISDEYRVKGIGEALKQKQRELAIERGYDKIVWTYDPLETRNAYLNLTKLNAICDTYIENCYGEMEDGLNRGLPSDRFEVAWYIKSTYLEGKQHIDTSNALPIVAYKMNGFNWPVLEEFDLQRAFIEDSYVLPVPQNFQALKASDPKLALDWRFKTRTIIQKLFSQGYAAIRLEKGKDVHRYVFVKKELIIL